MNKYDKVICILKDPRSHIRYSINGGVKIDKCLLNAISTSIDVMQNNSENLDAISELQSINCKVEKLLKRKSKT